MLRLKKYPKRSPYYYIRGTVAGRYICESAKTTDRLQAERYKSRRENEIWQHRQLGERRAATFADAMTAYIDSGGEQRFLVPLLDYFSEKALSEIGQAQVDAAAQVLQPDCKASTRARQVYGPVIAILNHAADVGLPGATRHKIKMPKIQRVPARWAGEGHIEALLPHCSSKLRAYVLVSTVTGLRASEMLRQRRPDYELHPGWVHIGKTKTGDPAFVPLTADALSAVNAIMPIDLKPVFGYRTVQGVNKALKKSATRARLTYMSTHQIGRHSFAARMLRAGFDIKTVKEAGRWKKLSTVDEIYGHLEQRAAHDAMLEAGNRVKSVVVKK